MTENTPSGIVTLLSDFGLADVFVGIVKGVLLSEAPSLRVVDLSHGVPAQDVEAAAFLIAHSFSWFPRGSVHLCVVDPGVGSARAAIVCCAHGHFFVAPDNGLLSRVIASDARAQTRRVVLSNLGLAEPSRTFHGRDVFAPVAARLAAGRVAFEAFGPLHAPALEFRDETALEAPRPSQARIVWVDRFGNLISDFVGAHLRAGAHVVELAGRTLRLVGTYADAEPGECVALVSSFGTLEIAARNASAEHLLGVGRGTSLRVRAQEKDEAS